MKNAIITGFEPFGGYPVNPTEKYILEIQDQIAGLNIHPIVLPCTYYGGYKTLKKAIDELDPELIINLGLSSSVQGIRIETRGENIMNGKYLDADGYGPEGIPIMQGAQQFVEVSSNANTVAEVLVDKGIQMEFSNDAEGFICNSLMYLTNREIQKHQQGIKNVFLHIPWTDDFRGEIEIAEGKIWLPKQDLINGVEGIIENREII